MGVSPVAQTCLGLPSLPASSPEIQDSWVSAFHFNPRNIAFHDFQILGDLRDLYLWI